MHRGYLKLWRKLEDSGLLQIPNTYALFTFLLLKAAHKPKKIGTPHGVVELQRGEYISGRIELALALKQSERQVRTSLDRLKEMDILTIKSTSRYSIYTIVKYEDYQTCDQPATSTAPTDDQQTTSGRPADDQQATTKQTLKAFKNEKNVKKKTAAIADDVFPDVSNRQLVEDWLVIRKAKKLPVTPTALDGIAREFMKAGFSNEDGLRKCCEKGWAGFEAKWVLADSKGIDQQGDQAREGAWARLFGGNQ